MPKERVRPSRKPVEVTPEQQAALDYIIGKPLFQIEKDARQNPDGMTERLAPLTALTKPKQLEIIAAYRGRTPLPVIEPAEEIETANIIAKERNAWRSVLGVEIGIKPLPEYVTAEVIHSLESMGFSLRYIPKLDVNRRLDLMGKGVKDFLTDLERRYPKWRRYQGLDQQERADYRVSRNLNEWYWERVLIGHVDFPTFPGVWMAVETAQKPYLGKLYPKTPVADRLGFPDSRFSASWDMVHDAIEREKQGILRDVHLSGNPVDMRLLEAHEYNLLANREGWDRRIIAELTNTEYRGPIGPSSLIAGFGGGAENISWVMNSNKRTYTGFRTAVVLSPTPRH